MRVFADMPLDRKRVLSLLCIIFAAAGFFFFTGCAAIMSSATSGIITDLSTSIMDSDDLKMVEDGAPAYLLMVDSLIAKDPDNENMLANAALLYTAYADIFVADKKRSRKLSEKALSYAVQAMCRADKRTCDLKNMNFDDFETIIKDIEKTDVPVLFALGNSWAAWIMANQSDFDAIADISRIETIMQHILFLDEKYKDGSAYLYLGALATLLPPALGGTPEKGKTYFEKALDISQGKNLMVNVLFAKQYARMMFDRKLHDQLLSQVVKADPRVPGYTLINTHAQRQARELLGSADDYF